MKNTTIQYRVGEWLPSDQKILNEWLEDLINEIEEEAKTFQRPFHPVIVELQELIESDAQIYALVTMMFDQVPHKYKDKIYAKQIRDYKHFLKLLNKIMTQTPTFSHTGCVGFPINALLDFSMGTEGGFALFLNEKFNAGLKKVLDHWGVFLKSEDSQYILSTCNEPLTGVVKYKKSPQYNWLSDKAMVSMINMLRQNKKPLKENQHKKARKQFINTFECNPDEPHYGFSSWDDFFTREFREGLRPIASPDDDSIIVNACESAPLRIVRGDKVNLYNKFSIKGQPYSLIHMLDSDERTEQFVGGTIYQAFLSATSYHRWNSPISGKIIKTKIINGTYYSETPVVGYDTAAPNDSQGYISEVATRALMFIESDNPKIGLMCIVFIGMAEVSSCDIQVYEGQVVKKGQAIGTFHFGGSSHCLLFRKGVDIEFNLPKDNQPRLDSYNLFVGSQLATVK